MLGRSEHLFGAGDGPQFERVYARYRMRVYRVIRGIVLEEATAEDLAQETFERTFRWMRTHEAEDVARVLHRVAVNLAISYVRRQRLTSMLPFKLYGGEPPALAEEVENRNLATRALASLSPRLRVVVVLHYYCGMTREEIAGVLGIPSGTVASRMAAAMPEMRKALESDLHHKGKGAKDTHVG